MENASKALIMAGGVLIGVLIISLAVYLFVSFGKTSEEIHTQNALKQINQFNAKFTSYENNDKILLQDIITITNFAIENNKYYDNDPNYTVKVIWDGDDAISEINYIKSYLNEKISIRVEPPTYTCKKISYHDNGRVSKIEFKENR